MNYALMKNLADIFYPINWLIVTIAMHWEIHSLQSTSFDKVVYTNGFFNSVVLVQGFILILVLVLITNIRLPNF